jgi:hypothetical protein
MMKCPFCQFENEDGALFCEQCKSDLGVMEPVAAAAPVAAVPVEAPYSAIAEAPPIMTPIVMEAAIVESAAIMPLDTAIPLASPVPEHAPSAFTQEPPVAAVMPATEPIASDTIPMMPQSAPQTVEATAPPAAAPAAPPAAPSILPPDAQPRLVVLRGQKRNVEYPVYEGHNYIGRADEKPVDIDLEDQEPPDRIWSSRQHAVVTFEDSKLVIEDLNSSNGTFVNRNRLYPGQRRDLSVGDVIQIGTVQLKVIV